MIYCIKWLFGVKNQINKYNLSNNLNLKIDA